MCIRDRPNRQMSHSPSGDKWTGSPTSSPKGTPMGGKEVWNGHKEPVLCCCYSKDGRTVIAASHDRSLSVWAAPEGQLVKKLDGGHTSAIYWCALSPDGETVASASHDETCKLWSLREGKWYANLRGHDGPVRSCSFSPDGALLATGSYDKSIKIWDVEATRGIHTLTGHRGMVRTVDFSPDGTMLASAGNDLTIRLWMMPGATPGMVFEGHTDIISTVTFSSTGALLASASYDFTVRLWDPNTGETVRQLTSDDQVLSCSFSRDETMVTTTSNAQVVEVWNTADGSCFLSLTGHAAPVFSARFGPHGRMLVSGSHDCTLRMWDLEYERVVAAQTDHSEEKARQAKEDEANRLAAEAEAARLAAEEEKRRRAAEAEARRLAEEEKRRQAVEEARRLAAMGAEAKEADRRQAEYDWKTQPCTVSAGGWYTLIIGKDGHVYCLGDNLMGQCAQGHDGKNEYTVPTVCTSLPVNQVRQVSAGNEHSSFVLATGQVLTCGSNDHGQLALPGVMDTPCLLYTSDAADEEDSVDLGGRRIL
eukprot:TRINITY_DN11719_c0_g1_i2.p1 TRINITY_DN11719_c0_g1~~TRINITY_DN11719_c0_g1_i2.p1  ORF type:complete len:535 (+),score=139.01 TRINITY_DN11719_c0_g1_i2:91-1695(+)